MIDWYMPWSALDWGLRLQLIVWLVSVFSACWISFRTLILGRPWLENKSDDLE